MLDLLGFYFFQLFHRLYLYKRPENGALSVCVAFKIYAEIRSVQIQTMLLGCTEINDEEASLKADVTHSEEEEGDVNNCDGGRCIYVAEKKVHARLEKPSHCPNCFCFPGLWERR